VQSDPIGLAGGLNTYGYALQNPVMNIDPYGQNTLILNGGRLLLVPVPGARIVGGALIVVGGGALIYDMCTESDEELEKRCEGNLDRDMETCDAIANAERAGKRPAGAAARCRSSAMQRYGNCLAGRDPGPLDTWNN
jgi:uncharacterized protein RhaS with RHS repeats